MIFYLSSLSWVILVRLLVLICGVVFITWLYSVARCHLSLKSDKPLVEIQLEAMIEGLLFALVVYAVYVFFFISLNGKQCFTWDVWTWDLLNNIYFQILPEILSLVCILIAFFFLTNKLSNLYK